ncbi:MAG: hypothetical protein IPN59_04470 [Holophaga sp.]|nr:hypothetical protein [Holophaga sp.]
MAEITTNAAPNITEPKQICEKCRNEYTLDHFQHGVTDQAPVCRRCLAVMGYKLT